MKLGIFFNENQTDRQTACLFAEKIANYGGEAVVLSRLEEIQNVDRLIVLGGDGTILRAAKKASFLNIPLMGINYGRLGFLTEFERGEIDKAAQFAVRKNCSFVRRSMLEADLDGKKYQCLNELALLRPVQAERESHTTCISVMIDGSTAGNFTADGLIVATPTGSTAYSLSAGGSIMTPDCQTFLLTPVCAFSLRSRPIAYPDSRTLSFVFSKEPLVLYGDGTYLGEVSAGHSLTVKKAKETVAFLTVDPNGYFRRLTEKINNG